MINTIAKIAAVFISIISVLTYGFGLNSIPMNAIFTGYFLLNMALLTLQVSLHGFSSLKETNS